MQSPNGATMPALRLLAIFAHPDDEVFSCGGVMAQNKMRGIYNVLVCATKGEAGEISSPELAEPANLGLVRQQELIEAAHHMGVDELHFLGYRDSGMAGTAENQNPLAYANADASAVVPRLVRFLRTIRPQVVITFDPTGGYGHPDHLAIHRHTVAAFHAAADPAYGPELGAPWQAQRLFYPTFRRSAFEALGAEIVARGMEAPNWGLGEDGEPVPEVIDAEVDVSAQSLPKWQAFKSHRTQIGPKHPFMQVPEDFIVKWIGTEWFEQAWPTTKPDQTYSDLFAGLDS